MPEPPAPAPSPDDALYETARVLLRAKKRAGRGALALLLLGSLAVFVAAHRVTPGPRQSAALIGAWAAVIALAAGGEACFDRSAVAWRTFIAAEDGFRVEMPCAPVRSTDSMPSSEPPVQARRYSAVTAAGTCQVIVYEQPEGSQWDVDASLGGIIDDASRRGAFTSSALRDATLAGLPARAVDVVAGSRGHEAHGRLIATAVGHTEYVVMASESAASRCLETFRLDVAPR